MTKTPIISSILNVKASDQLNISDDFKCCQTKSIAQSLYDQENINEKNEKEEKEKS